MDIWDLLTKVLNLISMELRARETCVAPNKLSTSTDGKNKIADDLFTGLSLHVAENSKSANGSSAVKCVFCKGYRWPNNCRVITDLDKLEKSSWENKCFFCLNINHVRSNCPKSKKFFNRKGMHSTAVICNSKRDKRDKTATNDSSMNFHPVYPKSFSIFYLPTTENYLENLDKQEVRVTALSDQGLSEPTWLREWKQSCSWRLYAQKEFLFLHL